MARQTTWWEMVDFSLPPRDRIERLLAKCLTTDDLRNAAKSRVPRPVFDFVDGCAGTERGMTRALEAWDRIHHHPGSSATVLSGTAREVVAAGAAAAIGWRRTIRPADAHALTDTVYDRLFRELVEKLKPAEAGATVDLELTSVAYVARDRLRMAHQHDHDVMRWTLPVLFVPPEPLSVLVHKKLPDNAENLAAPRSIRSRVPRAPRS